MAVTVSSLEIMNPAALSDVAATLGRTSRSFATARDRLANGVQSPLAAEAAWSGNGQPAAVATVRLNRTGLRVAALRTQTAQNAVLGLQAALTTAQGLVRRLVEQARELDLDVADDGTVTLRDGVDYPTHVGNDEQPDLAAVRITVQLTGALAFANEVDAGAKQLLDRVSSEPVNFSDWADGAAADGNGAQVSAATVDLMVSSALFAAWSLAKPTPVLDIIHPRSGTPIAPVVGDWEELGWLGALVTSLVSRYLPQGVAVTFKDEQSSQVVEIDGKRKVQLTALLDLSGMLSASGEAKKGLGWSLDAFAGKRLEYTILTDPEFAADLDGDHSVVPFDPTSIPEGTSLVLDDSFYWGFDASGEYLNRLRGSVGYTHTETVSTGIERIDESTVRLTVGDAELVEHRVGGRYGVDDLNIQASQNRTFEDGRLRTIDVDITTLAGRAAYDRFLATGELPPGGTEGTSNESVTDVSTGTSNLTVEADVAVVEPTILESGGSGTATTTVHADGSTERSVVSEFGGTSMDFSAEYDADGNPTNIVRAINLDDVSEPDAEGYLDLRGESQDLAGDQDLRLTFTDDQLYEIQDQVRQKYEQSALDGDDLVRLADPYELDIMRADEAGEIYDELYAHAHGDPDAVISHLTEYAKASGHYSEHRGGGFTGHEAVSATASVQVGA